MSRRACKLAVVAAALLLPIGAHAASEGGFGLVLLVRGEATPEYHAGNATYVEALRGREYTLRITNPLPQRVAVALAVDGLNTIDARHGDSRSAAKWVLDPYESIEIAGWQTSGSEARRFYFTGERQSYGAWLGETDDLGVIEAVFYREKRQPVWILDPRPRSPEEQQPSDGAPAPAGEAKGMAAEMAPRLSDEYAATGIGERTAHTVERVSLDLERQPAATLRIRYEFRPQLEKLGVLPHRHWWSPLERREHARGFADRYCPDPIGRE